jgi:hypothetical protein
MANIMRTGDLNGLGILDRVVRRRPLRIRFVSGTAVTGVLVLCYAVPIYSPDGSVTGGFLHKLDMGERAEGHTRFVALRGLRVFAHSHQYRRLFRYAPRPLPETGIGGLFDIDPPLDEYKKTYNAGQHGCKHGGYVGTARKKAPMKTYCRLCAAGL